MEKRDRLLILALCVLAAAMRLYRLGHQSLWVDEILTLAVSDPKPGLNIWDYLQYNIHGPAHAFIVYLVHLWSTSEFWLRLPSAAAGVITVLALYRWVSFWIGRTVALVACTLLTINPMHLYYSQEVRNYSFVLMFGVLASYFFHRLLQRETKPRIFLFCLTTALAALSNFIAAFLFATHTLLYFIHRRISRSSVKRWLVVCVIILILIAPWIYRIYAIIDVSKLVTPVMPGELSTTERLRGTTTVDLVGVPYAFYVFSVGFSLGPSLRELHGPVTLAGVIKAHLVPIALTGLAFGAVLLYGLLTLVRRRRIWLALVLYSVIPILCTLLLCWQNAKAFNPRYLIVGLPAYICIISCGLVSIRRRIVKIVLYVTIVFLSVVSIGNYYFNGAYARENVRDAVRHLEKNAAPDECVFAPTVREVVEHYVRTPLNVLAVLAPEGTPRRMVEERLERRLAGCDSLWYIRARSWVDDPDGYILRYLDRTFTVGEVREFDGCSLIHYTGRREEPGVTGPAAPH